MLVQSITAEGCTNIGCDHSGVRECAIRDSALALAFKRLGKERGLPIIASQLRQPINHLRWTLPDEQADALANC